MTDPRALAVPTCPLCAAGTATPFHEDVSSYFRCETCGLIYMHPADRLPPDRERARYLEHNNDVGDPGYLAFLRRLADPMIAQMPPGARGLDFGCGTVPALAAVFSAAGFPCESYDPFFRPEDALLGRRYDFIACSEVLEHVFDPAAVFQRLFGLLEDGGLLGVMTRFYGHEASFDRWWYRRDPTHVCFYSEPVLVWVAERHGRRVEFPHPHVALFHAG